MSQLNFRSIKLALLDWPLKELPDPGSNSSSLFRRLWQILEPARQSGIFDSLPDLMVLIRQLLLSESDGLVPEPVTVPLDPGWPSPKEWEKFGLRITSRGATSLRLEPKPWQPEWLFKTSAEDQADAFDVEHRAILVRRTDAGVPMDPFIDEATGYGEYMCPGQREAILSAFFMPKGNSLVVNLPTGSGKTLVAQAPLLVNGFESGLTLVVVPTNALALDLERRTCELIGYRDKRWKSHELAWLGGLSEESRKSIKERIRSGQQGILFASPEAVCGALLHSLYNAASKGLISYFVIDEAHLVAQWGDAFRPAFQQIAGVRRGLLKESPREGFRTLLLSATFSPQTIRTLESLFGPKDKMQMVSAVHLRPEPRYISQQVSGREEKSLRVEELIRFVPRPFILYTTTREDSVQWTRRLHSLGFRRLACISGETPNSEREKLITEWGQDEIDGMVATSAFGVGMDKADVRTIIHAALPETLDRFYQEVGRGGRDGCASLSITIFDEKDVRIAKRMSVPTLIGDDKGFDRWSMLFRDSEKSAEDSDVRVVDIRKTTAKLQQETEYNRDWNMRTLIMLARSGLISLDSTKPTQIDQEEFESDEEFNSRLEKQQDDYFSRIAVRILDPNLMNRSHFEQCIGDERKRAVESATEAFSGMLEALRGRREMSSVLGELFHGNEVVVSPVCRGCPSSGGLPHDETPAYQIPAGIGISSPVAHDLRPWNKRFEGIEPSFCVVFYPETISESQLLEALQVSVSVLGIKEVAIPPGLLRSNLKFSQLHKLAEERVLVMRDSSEIGTESNGLPLARATVLFPWSEKAFPDELMFLQRPLHLVFVPATVPDSLHPLRLYRDTAMNAIEFNEFMRKVC